MSATEPGGGETADQRLILGQLKAEVWDLLKDDAGLRCWANDHTFVRYLRARNWNLAKASKMIRDTIQWRLEYKPHLIRFREIKQEAETGKQMIYPCADKTGRPIVLMRPRLENTKTSDSQVRFLMYHLEHASRMADKSAVGKMCWLLDFEGYSYSNAPPLRVSMHCNHVLQYHYPERLGLAACFHAPMLFSATWKAVSPFIDPVTKAKIKFIDKGAKEAAEMEEKFHMDQMEQCLGGKMPGFAFKLEEYEKRMMQYDAEVEAELAAMEALIRSEKEQAQAGNCPKSLAEGSMASSESAPSTTTAALEGEDPSVNGKEVAKVEAGMSRLAVAGA